jgi:hypothetical protein
LSIEWDECRRLRKQALAQRLLKLPGVVEFRISPIGD